MPSIRACEVTLVTGDPTQRSAGGEDSRSADARDSDVGEEPSYFYAGAAGTQGSYDGFETWSVHLAATISPQQQVGACDHRPRTWRRAPVARIRKLAI